MLLRGIIFAIVILTSPQVMAQVYVVLKNTQNNEPISGATVSKSTSDEMFISDSLGTLAITSTGIYEARHLGYKTTRFSIEKESVKLVVKLEPDYLLLNTVEVRGFENDNSYLSVAGGINLVNKATISEFNQESLVRAINTTPGVRMEERSPSSYRLSIRGSLLRAPFGVRNVKVYWNDIPYNDPTGNAYLYFIDNVNVDHIEIIKGPAGSMFGAGMGGALILSSSVRDNLGLHGYAGYSTGSFGYHKVTGGLTYVDGNSQTRFSFSSQKADGYRDHTNSDRKVFQLQHETNYASNGTLSIHMLYSDLYYQLPGGLTLEEYNENPRQARQIAMNQNSSVDHQNILIGVNNRITWNEKSGNVTSVYYTNGTKENPFNTNYELERLGGIGGRTRFFHFGRVFDNDFTTTAGAEFQYGNFNASNHDNNGGYAGNLRFEDESNIYQGFVFGQLEYSNSANWILSFGGSLNYLRYNIQRLKEVATDSSYQIIRKFEPIFSPRVGVVKKLNDGMSIHASISKGFSPPTQEEIRTSDGNINEDIEAETGVNYEIGFRGNGLKNKLMFDVTLFYMSQNKTIVSRIEEGGNSRFENAGNTAQRGLETQLAYSLLDQPGSFISLVQLKASYTYHNFVFKNYVKRSGTENIDYSGNDLTGTAPHILAAGVQLKSKNGFYFFTNYNFTDQIPLNDANSVLADAYQLVNVKMGWQVKGRTQLDIYTGIDNLLNEKYSLGNDLNAFGNRYYEPSPVRNYYVGVQFEF